MVTPNPNAEFILEEEFEDEEEMDDGLIALRYVGNAGTFALAKGVIFTHHEPVVRVTPEHRELAQEIQDSSGGLFTFIEED